MFSLPASSITRTLYRHRSITTSLKSSSLSLQRSDRQSLSLRSSLRIPIAFSVPARQAHLQRTSSVAAMAIFMFSRLVCPTTATMAVITATIQSTAIKTIPLLSSPMAMTIDPAVPDSHPSCLESF